MIAVLTAVAFCGSLLLAGTVYNFRRKHDKEKDAKEQKRKQFDLRIEDRSSKRLTASWVPMIYDLNKDTEYKLEESEDDMCTAMRTGGDKGAQHEKQVTEVHAALAKHIAEVQVDLERVRDTRCGTPGTSARDAIIEQCQHEIGKGGASGSAAVYQAVFQTIESLESEGMAKYQDAAKVLEEQLRQVTPLCEQNSTRLGDLYKEALLVEDRAFKVMNGLHRPSESFKGSADGWRLERAALKKLRCAMHTLKATSPPLHLSSSPCTSRPFLMTVSCVCGRSRACEKIVLEPGFTLQGGKDGNYQWTRGFSYLVGRRDPSEPQLLAPKGHPGAKRICDIVRLMFVCDTSDDMATLLHLISGKKGIEVVRFKDRIANPSGGWRDAMINFRIIYNGCSHICEVQIVHKKMAMCRNKDGLGGHDEYARERNAREILQFLGVEAIEGCPSSPDKNVLKIAGPAAIQMLRRSSRDSDEESEKSVKASVETAAPRVTLSGAGALKWVLSGAGALRRIMRVDPAARYRAHQVGRRASFAARSASVTPHSLFSPPQPPGKDEQGASGSPVVSSFVDAAVETVEDLP